MRKGAVVRMASRSSPHLDEHYMAHLDHGGLLLEGLVEEGLAHAPEEALLARWAHDSDTDREREREHGSVLEEGPESQFSMPP